MRQFYTILLIVFLLGMDSCKKEENSTTDQFPGWLQTKITELTSEFNLCEYTDVTIIEYNGKTYYHIYCGVWSCSHCQLFDDKGNHAVWEYNEFSDFLKYSKVIKALPACP
jgi:hypothetical protein